MIFGITKSIECFFIVTHLLYWSGAEKVYCNADIGRWSLKNKIMRTRARRVLQLNGIAKNCVRWVRNCIHQTSWIAYNELGLVCVCVCANDIAWQVHLNKYSIQKCKYMINYTRERREEKKKNWVKNHRWKSIFSCCCTAQSVYWLRNETKALCHSKSAAVIIHFM